MERIQKRIVWNVDRGDSIEIDNFEIKYAIKVIIGDKVPGVNRIMIEHMKVLDENGLEILLDFCSRSMAQLLHQKT